MSYPLVATLLGLAVGWLPMYLHGPIPEKFNLHYIQGAIAVWGWYIARLSIGFWVGITRFPQAWYLRGPMCGFLVLLPLTFVSLATPECGAPCMCWNLTTASVLGFSIAGVALLITGQSVWLPPAASAGEADRGNRDR